MLKRKARWKLAKYDETVAAHLAAELNISSLVAKLLVNRGITTIGEAKRFLYIEKQAFYDPFLLEDMDKAVARITKAIKNKEKILIYGDYDSDGVSSTALMVYVLKQLDAHFDYYIPNRFTEGYGPNENAFRKAKEDGITVIVTVDTGIAAVYEAEVAKEIGIDLIITDHHEPQERLPEAFAIINPKKKSCPYPFKGLAGVGVALKLAHALLGEVPEELLEIATIGTVADLVPLVDENRLLVKKGIEQLQNTTKPGLVALKKVCRLDDQTLNADHVGFSIGPRLNAAGRLGSADPAVQLLITDDAEEGALIAAEIEQLNNERKTLVNKMVEEAVVEVETKFPLGENCVLLVGKEGWNPGVLGIVASRLIEKYYRPTIILSIDRETGLAKGSARSIEGFNIFENLAAHHDILTHFGGHSMAAGLTINIEDIEELRMRLNQQAKEQLTEEDFIPITSIDLEVPLKEISLDVIEEIEKLSPFGINNPTPKVVVKDVSIGQMRKIGSDDNHLKLVFEQEGTELEGIGFHLGYLHDEISMMAKVSALGRLTINEWNGRAKPQFFLEDVAVDEWQLFDWRNTQQLPEKLSALPKENRLFICFRDETVAQLSLSRYEDEIVFVEREQTQLLRHGSYLVLLDLPHSLEQLERLLEQCEKVERIYAVFSQQADHFFSTQPTREQFKWFYAFLMKRGTFNIEKQGFELAKYKGWTKDTIAFMTNVFFELDFVTLNEGVISIQPNPKKRDLTQSKTYVTKVNETKLEQRFVYSTYLELKQWFDIVLARNSKVKETV